MKRTVIIVGILALASALTGCSDTLSVQAQSFRQKQDIKVKRVAVVDFAGNGGQAIADMLTMHLARCGYEVVERQNIDDLLGNAIDPIEQNATSATVTERLGKIGKLLNADAVITGDLINRRAPRYIPSSDNRLKYEAAVCEVSARAFDVSTREVFWTCVINVVATAKTGEELGILDYIDQACYELTESFANPNYDGNGSHLYTGQEILARQH